MSVPKPGSWLTPKNVREDRKPFILKEHLSNRPLMNNPELLELRDEIKKGKNK